MSTPSFDFSGVTSALSGLAPQVVTAGAAVLGAGIIVAGAFWGFPKLIGLFKKTAK